MFHRGKKVRKKGLERHEHEYFGPIHTFAVLLATSGDGQKYLSTQKISSEISTETNHTEGKLFTVT